MSTTRISRHIAAPRALVYAALIDPGEVARWMAPHGMSARVDQWNAHEGGAVRVTLSYDDAETSAGKTTPQTDIYQGRFVALVPNEKVVMAQHFETAHPALQGEMTSTILLRDDGDGATMLEALHENLPPGVNPEDNETGWSMALDKLAALIEAR